MLLHPNKGKVEPTEKSTIPPGFIREDTRKTIAPKMGMTDWRIECPDLLEQDSQQKLIGEPVPRENLNSN